ncbi:MAG: flippase-like domain-containing protein [Bacteroidetes bacterium]|nr:flippase-like domain-containing protein [Bacteroidota bacterium]
MKKYLLTAIKFLVFLSLGILLIWLAVKDLTEEDKTQIKKSLAEANYFWIALAMLIGIVSHISRAMRWKMLLAPLNLSPKLSTTFYAVMIGYMGNLALPRLGEVLRCGILKRYEKIPLTQSFGTVISERVVDLISLVILFGISIWVGYERMHDYISQNIFSPLKLKLHSLLENKILLLVLTGGVLLLLFLLFLFRKKILQNPLAQKIRGLLLGFLDGIRSVALVKNPLLFIFHSAFIWFMYLLTVYVCVFAFSETKSLTLGDSLLIMTFGSLGVIATPGGIGAYQWIVLQIMLFWGYSTAMGVAFGWVVWLAQTVVVLLFGLLSFGLLAINNRENSKIQIPNNK